MYSFLLTLYYLFSHLIPLLLSLSLQLSVLSPTFSQPFLFLYIPLFFPFTSVVSPLKLGLTPNIVSQLKIIHLLAPLVVIVANFVLTNYQN